MDLLDNSTEYVMLKDYQLFTNSQKKKLKTYTLCSQLSWDNTVTQTKVMSIKELKTMPQEHRCKRTSKINIICKST